MLSVLRDLLRDDDGATLVEYSLVVALIAGVAIAVLTTMGTSIKGIFSTVNDSVNTSGGKVGS